MTIKKMLLSASMALAAVALMAPAAQANDTWTTNGDPIGGAGNKTTVDLTGLLATTVGPFTTGPAEVHGHGQIWNGAEMGEGTITEFVITGELAVTPTGGADCTATGTPHLLPWKVTLTTGIVDITAGLVNHYNAVCQALGFPASATTSGILTGVISEESNIVFENAGDLKTTGGAPTNYNGEIVITDTTASKVKTGGVIGIEPMP